jgi:hypothetical protein
MEAFHPSARSRHRPSLHPRSTRCAASSSLCGGSMPLRSGRFGQFTTMRLTWRSCYRIRTCRISMSIFPGTKSPYAVASPEATRIFAALLEPYPDRFAVWHGRGGTKNRGQLHESLPDLCAPVEVALGRRRVKSYGRPTTSGSLTRRGARSGVGKELIRTTTAYSEVEIGNRPLPRHVSVVSASC